MYGLCTTDVWSASSRKQDSRDSLTATGTSAYETEFRMQSCCKPRSRVVGVVCRTRELCSTHRAKVIVCCWCLWGETPPLRAVHGRPRLVAVCWEGVDPLIYEIFYILYVYVCVLVWWTGIQLCVRRPYGKRFFRAPFR